MSIVVEETAHVLADPEVIWSLLADPPTWPGWWPGCLHVAVAGGRRFDEGASLEIVLQPRVLKTTYRPEVDLFTPGKTLSLTHRGPFRQCTVGFHLSAGAERVRLDVRGVFEGAYFFFLRVLQQGSTPQLSLHGAARGLRRAAERRAAGHGS